MAARRNIPSMVRQSDFDPTQGPATFYDPMQRLAQLEQGFATNPGRRPNGTGLTGLMSQDSRGYSRMLEEQQEYLKLKALAEGKAEPEIELGGTSTTARPYQPTFDPSFQGSAVVGIGNPNANGPADSPSIRGLLKAGRKR